MLSTSTAYCATIRRASVGEADVALTIIREAAAWAAARGIGVWEQHELRPEAFAAAARKAELVIGYAGATAAATMLLQTEDPVYWPGDAPRLALYLHKVAIRRAYAGHGWLGRLIEFAVEDASSKGIGRLRLDTILRPKLQSMYERHGFRVLAEPPLVVAGRQMIRLERILGTQAVGNP